MESHSGPQHPSHVSMHRLPLNRSLSPKQTVPGPKHKKPPPFDGTGSARDFLIQFEMISQICQWDQAMMALELVACLRGSALESSSIRPYPCPQVTLTPLINFDPHHEPGGRSKAYITQFFNQIFCVN